MKICACTPAGVIAVLLCSNDCDKSVWYAKSDAYLTVLVARMSKPLVKAAFVHELDGTGALARVKEWVLWLCL